jgi:hypothetical protein
MPGKARKNTNKQHKNPDMRVDAEKKKFRACELATLTLTGILPFWDSTALVFSIQS